MKLDNDMQGGGSALRIIIGCIASLAAITLVLAVVVYSNQDKLKKKKPETSVVKTEEELEIEKELEADKKLTSDDLDFWGMYDDKDSSSSSSSTQKEYENIEVKTKADREAEALSENEISANSISKNSVSDNSFNAADSGEPEYIEISEDIPLNKYVADGFRQEGQRLAYYSSNRRVSSYGIDVSKYQGDIDFEKVKEAGVDFVMIRMGVRGYSTGNVVVDETYEKNMNNAIANGLDVGIYFYSQATSIQEAVEEANYAVTALAPYTIAYPIAFYTEPIANDVARTDSLTVNQLTEIAKAFCDTIKGYGFKPIICASKHTLATGLDMSALKDVDVWLMDPGNDNAKVTMSEYPYQYTIWQYSNTGLVDGINGDVDLNISFVDYKYR